MVSREFVVLTEQDEGEQLEEAEIQVVPTEERTRGTRSRHRGRTV